MITIFFHHRRLSTGVATLIAGLAVAVPGMAATSPWAVSDGGRMRVVALAPDAAGMVRAGLQIEPAPGWITYWREPGDSGIPPQVTVTPGDGVTLDSLSFPVPKRVDQGEVRDIGYDAAVTLPMVLHVDAGAQPSGFTTQVFIGLCKNICIPFQAELPASLAVATQSEPDEAAILDAAAALLPEAPSADFAVAGFAMAADRSALRLDLVLPKGSTTPPEVIVTGPNGYVFTRHDAGTVTAKGLSVTLPIARLPKTYILAGKRWGVLVKAGGRAMETTLAFD